MGITLDELYNLDVERILSDYYLLERLVADGSRSARRAQVKLESWAAPRLMYYISAICGGEMRHVGADEGGCDGWDCSGDPDDRGKCSCCGYDEYDHETLSDECIGCGYDAEAHEEQPCTCEDEDCDDTWTESECDEFNPANLAGCDCYCPMAGLCEMCELAENWYERCEDLPPYLLRWVERNRGDGRSECWDSWLDFHKQHGSDALQWLMRGFLDVDWVDGYGGESWAFIAQVGWEYATGRMTAHAFMDRVWTLQHNGGNIFDKMHDPWRLDKLLRVQAADNYAGLARYASPEVRDLWAIRPFVLSESLDRDPAWLGRDVPQEVDW